MDIVDSFMGESYPVNEVLKCMQIAFLCVQEYAADRPTMSEILFMLANDVALPSPRRPAFLLERNYINGELSTRKRASSVNDMTFSTVEAR